MGRKRFKPTQYLIDVWPNGDWRVTADLDWMRELCTYAEGEAPTPAQGLRRAHIAVRKLHDHAFNEYVSERGHQVLKPSVDGRFGR